MISGDTMHLTYTMTLDNDAMEDISRGLRNQQEEIMRLKEKSLLFFQSFLTDEEKDQWEKEGFCHIVAQSGKHYILENKCVFNVYDGAYSYCLDTDEHLPVGDVFAFQKFLLENDEDTFVETANCHGFLKREPFLDTNIHPDNET